MPKIIENILKTYPKKTTLIKYHEPYITDLNDKTIKNKKPKKKKLQIQRQINSIKRTKTKISDYILSNEFHYFTTYTFNKDRQNLEKCKYKMHIHLKIQKRKYPNLKYLIIPEFHKDKKSIHFHALINYYDKSELKPTGIFKNSAQIYNVTSYKYGFSTTSKITDYEKTSSYIRKYITKDMPQFAGKKRYWCTKNLERPIVQTNVDLSQYQLVLQYETEKYTLYTATKHLKKKTKKTKQTLSTAQ